MGFDSLDDDFPQQEHKDLKRSDPHATISTSSSTTSSTSISTSKNQNQTQLQNNHSETHHEVHQVATVSRKNSQPQSQPFESSSPRNRNSQPRSSSSSSSSNGNSNNSGGSSTSNSNYDKVLLTPQDQYIPTLPKIIITASASVSDASGKKLNYSVGNVIASNIKLPPLTNYDEYREDDVALDPFFLDVPKIAPRRTRRATLQIVDNKRPNLANNRNRRGPSLVVKKKKRKIKVRFN